MTNASCADCGRIVAFRTHDPSEIAECRNCGTWVKRSPEMPGVAVSVKKTGPVARKTPLPPRKDQGEESTSINTRRSATKRTSETVAGRGETMTPAAVYASIRDLQKSVFDLQKGQDDLQEGQKELLNTQQEILEGQKILLERTLPVSEMPSPGTTSDASAETSPSRPATTPYPDPSESNVPEGGFYTTRFSSLKIPLIPLSLDDLGYTPNYSETGTAASIPAEERSDLTGLLEGPLPEPPAFEPEQDFATPADNPSEDDTAPAPSLESNPDFAFEAPAHDSPFTIEGPPEEPFSIAEDSPSETPPPTELPPQPFGAKKYSHEPCDIDDPFSQGLDTSSPGETDAAVSPFAEAPKPVDSLPSEDSPEEKDKSLSQQIAAAKKGEQNSFDPAQPGLLAEPGDSRLLPALVTVCVLGAALIGYLFFFTDTFTSNSKPEPAPPLLELPAYGIPLPEDDPRIEEAKEVAEKFLKSKTVTEVQAFVRPVDSDLLSDFWEPLTAPTIERLFQGRIMEGDRVEVDLLIQDYGRKERLLPLIKVGEGPFQVDWKSYAECEDLTLLALAQGTLILDSGEVDEGSIRSWMQSGKGMDQNDLGNFQGFRLHNFTEEVVAFAVVRRDSEEFKTLTTALEQTELKHKGKPAIRAVLQVKRIEKEDLENKKPARLEILKVIATDWNANREGEDELIPESLPDVPAEAAEGTETESSPEEAPEENAGNEGQAQDELPPVPNEDAPLATTPGESPLIRITVE
ncbi:hypothetical protein AAFN60_21610 [Roseibacillus persicicus]|uniref:hypothetical protein n=1 Tax=Roseibacillus persicicus TaxID=454148 RepID=UPI00398AE18B